MKTKTLAILSIAIGLSMVSNQSAEAQNKTVIVVGQPLTGTVRTNGAIVHWGLPVPPTKDSVVAGRDVARLSTGAWIEVPIKLGDRVLMHVSDLGGRIVAREQLVISGRTGRRVRVSRTERMTRGLYAVVMRSVDTDQVARLVVWID